MDGVIEKLIKARDELLREIKASQGQVQSLEDAIARLSGQVKGLESAIEILKKDTDVDEKTVPQTNGVRYRGMGLTDAILAVMETDGAAPGLLPVEIVAKLTAGGFESNAQKLYQSVYGVGLNLIKTNRVAESKKDGKRAFMRR